MSVLVYIENPKGSFKKSASELVYYGRQLADAMGTECHALVLGSVNSFDSVSSFGAHKIHHADVSAHDQFDSGAFAKAISEVAKSIDAKVVVLGHTANGKALLGRVSVRIDAGSVSGVNTLPDVSNGFKVDKPVFSGKAVATYEMTTDVKVLSLTGNSLQPIAGDTQSEIVTASVPEYASNITIKSVNTVEGTVPLPEAELVVSAGRGMKDPGNWGIIDELADVLGATTACSRPVADIGWRPHHEHVGQTGVAIRPNLYIAAGISGAIQHLAGVNQSKTIVVINKDPEAPFFKAADYGVCADLFDVVPRLKEALKKYKANN